MNEQRQLERAKSIVEWASFIGALACIGAGLLWAYEALLYLKTGQWPGYSVITALQWMGNRWAFEPDSWIGVFKILEWMPLPVGIVAIVFAALSCALSLYDDAKEAASKSKN